MSRRHSQSGGPRPDHSGRRPRRGATLVFVAFLVVGLVGMVVLAADVSRMYVGVNELQTVTDATALRGAMELQRNPGVSPSDSIYAFNASAQNRALNGTVHRDSLTIRAAFYDTSGTIDTTVAWTVANAVQVTARKSAGFLFNRVLTSTVSAPTRRSAAWIANLNSVDCIQPIGIPLIKISELLGQNVNTQAGVNALRALLATTDGPSQMTIIMGPPINSSYSGNTNAPRDGDFAPLTNQGSSPNGFEDMVKGGECDNIADWSSGDQGAQPGGGNQIAQRIDAFYHTAGPCQSSLALNAPICRDKVTGTPGTRIVVPLVTSSGNSATIHMLVSFSLQCVYNGSGFKQGDPSEHCPYLQTSYFSSRGVPTSNYPRMTVVGHLLPEFTTLGPGTGLGNNVSTAQRLILVK